MLTSITYAPTHQTQKPKPPSPSSLFSKIIFSPKPSQNPLSSCISTMEVGLDLFGSGVEGGISLGDGSLSTVAKAEPPGVALSPEVSSYALNNELDLGLGLSLGSSGVASNSKPKASWGEYARILTAKDFPPSLGSSGSSSSSSSSSGKPAPGGISPCSTTKAAVSGTKRAADDQSVAQEGGSPSGAVSNQVVGWPPLRSSRINILVGQTKNPSENDKVVTENIKHQDITKKKTDGNVQKRSHLGSSLFVKVNMDGVPIGRKVDLSAHTCYETLAVTLEDMFFYRPTATTTKIFISLKEEKEHGAEAENTSKLLGGLSEFVLTYEDKDGDWMLVGDVPWGMFVTTAKRLKIMRTSEANGFAPISEGNSGRQRSKPN